MFRLDGKIALVTGAATGLGQAIAAALMQSRANVALTDKTVDALTETESMIKQMPNAVETPTGDFGGLVFIASNNPPIRRRRWPMWCSRRGFA